MAYLTSDNDAGKILYFAFNKERLDLQKGDKVAMQGNAFELIHLLKADGSYEVMSEMINLGFNGYVF